MSNSSEAADRWVLPTACDQCAHPVSEHVVWEPDEFCGGWMHCTAPGCTKCWHEWPSTRADVSLTREWLQRALEKRGVPAEQFDLYGASVNDRIVLDHQGSSWLVFYFERGSRYDERRFASEHEACTDVMNRLLGKRA